MRRLGGGFALLLCLVGIAAPAHAKTRRTVILWSAPSDSRALRLRAELETANFDVLSLATPQDVSRASIERAGHELAADAVVRFLPNAGEMQFWAIDSKGTAVLRDILQPANEENDDVIARRAAEIVRAETDALAQPVPERSVGPEPKREDVATSPDAGSSERTARSTFAVSAGPALMGSPGGGSVGLDALLGAEWRASDHVAPHLFVLAPVTASEVDDREGSARLRTFVVGGGARLYVASPTARWRPHVGLGAGLGWVQIDGSANASYVSRSTDKLTFLAYGSGGLSLALARHVELAAEARLGVATPGIGVEFAKREVATWGLPWMLGSLSAVFAW
jgi:hypothetical protein